ncbi:hypothetical protein P3W45_001761 [Vairimorpha bombi]|jgi:wee1-like protein kinase
MVEKKLFTLKQDITDTMFSTPKTPSKRIVYKDMIDSSVIDPNVPSDDIFMDVPSKDKLVDSTEEMVGEGDFFVVYRTRNNTVLKKSKSLVRNNLDREFYQKEVNLLKNIVSPYITKYINSFTYQSHFYIETEYCKLGTLREYIDRVYNVEKSRISEEMIRKIMYDVSSGLRDIHLQDIVHLDIKPENIFISGDYDSSDTWIFKIGDFGISRYTGEDITLDGDKRYMGPEVLQNICTPSSDIFSLGLIYIEILHGINLPKKGTPWQRLRKNDFRGIGMNKILRRMLYSNYKKRCKAEDVVKYFV